MSKYLGFYATTADALIKNANKAAVIIDVAKTSKHMIDNNKSIVQLGDALTLGMLSKLDTVVTEVSKIDKTKLEDNIDVLVGNKKEV